ncbi:TonB family C-terminal domain-containing protein [Dyadobacter sp. SG02]|uniref:M56 family metallopeptidase n=1 Tax=Dyadobacter sp. SG02 TaxID=1855291 RepID=UPI0008CC14D2|nr:M56 family metallopeptidase [Dyadobacter sp. SG02]SEJ43992.1 TonB family C-terminal domain-containing protein [Dyadobacter sp. SG02]
MEIFIYIGKVSLYWVLLYACYWLMLRKHTFFLWNRWYLLGSLLVAFALPEIIYPASAPELPVIYEVNASAFSVISKAPEKPEAWTWMEILTLIYTAGLFVAATVLARNIAQLVKYLRSGEVIELEDCSVILIDSNQVGSFSFLKWIVINRNDYEYHFDAILRHEMVHTQQRHSVDILLIEIIRTIFWFNPVLLLYKRSLQEIHEYLADAQAPNREYYAQFLVAYALNAPVASLTNHFFKPSQLKNRIQMIYKNRTSKWMLGTYVVAATLIGTSALFVAGCENQVSKENNAVQTDPQTADNARIFSEVEVQPEFPGGNAEMFKFLGRNIKYPRKASDANTQGKVFVSFVVTSSGEIEDVEVPKGIGNGCDEEASRVVSKFPKWTPGKQNGKAVSVKYTVPINFMIAEVGENTAVDPKKAKETTVVNFKPVSKPISQKSIEAAPLVGETFEAKAISNVEQPTPSDTKVTIRGTAGPFTVGTEPLYILDGEELEPTIFKTIDPNTISSINVLKGETATKIYGSKGVNGVVVINSKSK